MGNWLDSLNLNSYAHFFEEHEITGDILYRLKEDDLIQMGITSIGPRKQLLEVIDTIAKEHSHYHRHKTLWKSNENLGRGHCLRSIMVNCIPCYFDYQNRYTLTESKLKIQEKDRGCCFGLFRFDTERKANIVMLKNVVDVDTEVTSLCCGSDTRVIVSAQEGVAEAQPCEVVLYLDGKKGNKASEVAAKILAAVEESKKQYP